MVRTGQPVHTHLTGKASDMASCEQGLREITDNSSTCFFIRTEAPFDFERSANIHSHFQKSLPDVYENGLHKRVLHVCGKPVLVIVSSKGTTARPRLRVEAHPHLSIAEAKSLRNLLRTMFASSFDFHSFRSREERSTDEHCFKGSSRIKADRTPEYL